jgi:hypothetical protein
VSRSSYFQRIARTDRSGPALRPPPAIFRRWEMTQTPSASQRPADLVKDPIATAPKPKSLPSSAASPRSRTSTQLPETELSATPDRMSGRFGQKIRPNPDHPTEEGTIHAVKSSARANPVQAEVQPGKNLNPRKHRAKPEATREQVSRPRNVNSTAHAHPGSNVTDANLSPNPLIRSERSATPPALNLPGRAALSSADDEMIATAASGRSKSTKTPRLLQTHYRSHEQRESAPAQPLARLQANEKLPPTVKIGTIDVQITPPPEATPQPRMTRSSSSKPATALSRGFTSSFGLRQG